MYNICMLWTKELPVKAGLYKFRKLGEEKIVQVRILTDMGALMPSHLRLSGEPGGEEWLNLDCAWENEYSNGEWSGPIK